MQLREKFTALTQNYALSHEFSAAAAISSLITEKSHGRAMSDEAFLDLIKELYETDISDPHPLSIKIKQLLAIYAEIDAYNLHNIDWSQFSYAIQNCASNAQSSQLTSYYPHQTYTSFFVGKLVEPIYSTYYCPDSNQFAFSCIDNSIKLVTQEGKVTLSLKGHQSLPLACTSFRPIYAPNVKYDPEQKGYNYISTGADRKLIVWTPDGKITCQVATQNVHCILACGERALYRGSLIEPAIFTGDDEGEVSFYRLENQKVMQADDRRTRCVLGENEVLTLKLDNFIDELSDVQEQKGVELTADEKFTEYKKQQEVIQKSAQMAQATKISPTPIWSVKAHKGWVSALLFEHMADSDQFLLMSGGADGMIHQYDIDAGEEAITYQKHTGSVAGLAWLHQRGLIVSVGKDRQLNVWSPTSSGIHNKTHGPVASLPLNDQPFVNVFSSRNKQEFITVDVSGTVKQWDVRKMECVCQVIGNQEKNGQAVSAGYDYTTGTACVASNVCGIAHPQNQNQQLQISWDAIQHVVCSHISPGAVVVTEQKIQMWDLLRGECINEYNEMFQNFMKQDKTIDNITGQADNADQLGANVLAGMNNPFSSDKYGQVLLNPKLNNDHPIIEEKPIGDIIPDKEMTALCLSPNSQLLVAATDDMRVAMYSVQSGLLLCEIMSPKGIQNQKFKEKYDEMEKAKRQQERIKLHFLDDSVVNDEKETKEVVNQQKSIGIASDLYIGFRDKLILWVGFKEQRQVVAFDIKGKDLQQLVGRYPAKAPWVGSGLLQNLNNMYLYDDNELIVLNVDGSVLCKIWFKGMQIKFVQSNEDFLIICTDSNWVYFIEEFTMNAVAMVKIAEVKTAVSVQTCIQKDTILLLDEVGSICCYKLDGLNTLYNNVRNLVTQNPITSDVNLGLSVPQQKEGGYNCEFSSRRQYFNIGEIQQSPKQQEQFVNFSSVKSLLANPDFHKCYDMTSVSLNSTQISKFNKIFDMKISDLCLQKIHCSTTANLFILSSATGYIAIVSAQTGQFISFLCFGGWKAGVKSEIQKQVLSAQPNLYTQKYAQACLEAEEKCQLLIKNACAQILSSNNRGDPPVTRGLSEREKNSIEVIARKAQEDIKQRSISKLKKQRLQTKTTVQEAKDFIKKMQKDTKEQFRAMSEMRSPQTKLPEINRKNARSVLANALAEGSKTVQRHGKQTDKPQSEQAKISVKKGEKRVVDEVEGEGVENLEQEGEGKEKLVRQCPLPSILTMSSHDIVQRYAKATISPARGMRDIRAKLKWDDMGK